MESRAPTNLCGSGVPARAKAGSFHTLRLALAGLALLAGSCGPGSNAGGNKASDNTAAKPKPEILVAAAANLTNAFQEIGEAFTAQTGVVVTYNFGATVQLKQQIENGAPFDLFAAADVVHVDQLVASGKIVPASRAVYARGRLVLWIPPTTKAPIQSLKDLQNPAVRFVAIANPDVAPYGAAAVESLQKENLWASVKQKIVLAENVNLARQLAATGNADAAFTAYSLVMKDPGKIIAIDESLHSPINQALGIVAASPNQANARKFAEFVLRGGGVEILRRFGYDLPPTQ